MKNNLNKKGFSLAEMMVVMLVLAIILAAALPLFSRRSKARSSASPWKYDSITNSDIYAATGDTQGVIIGTSAFASGDSAKLLINTSDISQNQILFKEGGDTYGKLIVDSKYNIGFGDNITVETTEGYNTVINSDSRAIGGYSTALGYASYASGFSSIAIGGGHAFGEESIAIGTTTTVDTSYARSVSIGKGAQATASDQIVLGSIDHAVRIPGTLTVGTNGGNFFGATGTWLTTSDKRLKNINGDFTDGLDKIRQLNVYNYTLKKDKKKTPRIGVIAQDLQKVFPDAVEKDKKGYLLIRQEDMFYAMLNSIKQLDKIVQNILDDIKSLIVKLEQIDDKIAALIRVDQINSQKIKELEAKNKVLEARLKKLEGNSSKR
ncbi:MAG: tail fiber domain-containing protein [Candidatus Gastranaerophilales bacterium]|nr:tail fiber domain-containing protein [Candidatus Gastranaerophilales bacterium]